MHASVSLKGISKIELGVVSHTCNVSNHFKVHGQPGLYTEFQGRPGHSDTPSQTKKKEFQVYKAL